MKIILKQDVDKLGSAGDIVEVKDGFARNYLVPTGQAIMATKANLKSFEEERKMEKVRQEKGKKEAQELADKLSRVSITTAVQVGEENKVFGSVTSQEIANQLRDQGYDIDKRKILIEDPIKALGVYDVPVKLHTDVEATVKVWVVRE
ncbi:50S ribosomal protein L9 [candidate division KSB1 bacterium]|nr:50S ribosomal protein L9 [candidate division KSB1 bacterium]